MKTKKLIAGLISAVTFASVSVSAIASAADDFTVSISSKEVGVGEDFTLTVDLAGIPADGINACEFGVSFDSSVVTVESVKLGTLAKDLSGVEADMPEPLEVGIEKDIVNLMYAVGVDNADYYLKGSGTFLEINGFVNEDAKAGAKSTFKVVPIDRNVTPDSSSPNKEVVFGYFENDDKITKYTPAFTDGTVTVKPGEVDPTEPDKPTEDTETQKPTEDKPVTTKATTDSGNDKPSTTKATEEPVGPTTEAETPEETENIPDGSMYGDVNLDTRVNIADVVSLNLYLLSKEEYPLSMEAKANADVMRDNAVNTSDSSLLMNYVAELIPITDLGKK